MICYSIEQDEQEIDSDTLPRNVNHDVPGAPGADSAVSAFYNSLSFWRTTSCRTHSLTTLLSSPGGKSEFLFYHSGFIGPAVLMMMRERVFSSL